MTTRSSDSEAYDHDKLKIIKQSMDNCNRLTADMLEVLSGLEEKLVHLEGTIKPVHQQTQNLSAAKKNIEIAMTSTEDILKHYSLAMEGDDAAEARNNNAESQEYLEWVRKVMQASQFFNDNRDLKGSEKVQKRLKDMSTKAVSSCKEDFHSIMSTYNKPMEVLDTWPLKVDQELIPSALISKLASIAQTLDSAGHRDVYLEELSTARSSALKLTLKRVVHENINPLGNDKQTQHVGRYVKGTNKMIYQIMLFLSLLQLEYKLQAAVLVYTSMNAVQKHTAFLGSVAVPLEYFVRKMKESLHQKDPNKVLILLDMLETLDSTLPQYEKILKIATSKVSAEYASCLDLKMKVEAAVSRAIVDYVEYVTNYVGQTKFQKQVKDGTISTLTIETLSFVKRLSEYRTTVDRIVLPQGEAHGLGDEVTTTATFTRQLMSALETSLEAKAKTYKLEALAAVFLMNNYHYGKQLALRGELSLEGAAEHYESKLLVHLA